MTSNNIELCIIYGVLFVFAIGLLIFSNTKFGKRWLDDNKSE